MRIAYLDCASGISGDMTLAALVDAGADLDAIQTGITSLGLTDCRLVVDEVDRHGFRALHLTVEHPREHVHRHLSHITDMIEGSSLSRRQKETAVNIFTKLAEAEAKVHGTTVEKVHFHEVGAVDSIADIVGAAIGWDLLGVERIMSSAVPTGGGSIEIAHGKVNVPAPATAELLKGIPLATSEIEAELTTPTGAALLASLVDQFGPLPAMTIDRIGYGAGDHDFSEQANLLRLIVGETAEDDMADSDQIWVLATNLDDVSGEMIGYCTEMLAAAGALDVTTHPISMKKNRPGVELTVLCRDENRAACERLLFRETGTLGVRRWRVERSKLPRTAVTVNTPWGAVAGKKACLPDGSSLFSPEYEDCRQLALEHHCPIREVFEAAQQAWAATSADKK